MSLHVPVHYSQEYTTLLQAKLQQQGSRLRDAVMSRAHVGKAGVAVEQIGQVAGRKRTSRHADTPILDTPGDKRWVYPQDYEWGDMVDKQDQVRMIVDPTGPYVTNGVNAIGRNIDDEIVAAFFGDAKTGENGTTTVAFPAGQQVSASEGAAAATGLNVAKLKAAKRLLMAANVDLAHDRAYCAITAAQHDDLLNEIEAISLDFQTRPVLEEGLIVRFMGFDFIHTELLATNGSGQRRCPAWVRSGMHLGLWMDIKGQAYPRPDKSNNIQVLVEATIGATRLEEEKVVEIPCVES
jgi:hypothetical protein